MSVILSGYATIKPSSPPAGIAGTTIGGLDVSTIAYGYKVTYVTGFGETDPSPAVSVNTSTTGSINLSSIPVSTNGNVTARKLYRTQGGTTTYQYLTTLDDNYDNLC